MHNFLGVKTVQLNFGYKGYNSNGTGKLKT